MKIFIHDPEYSAVSYNRIELPVKHCYHNLSKEGIRIIVSKDILPGCDVYIFHRLIRPKLWEQIYPLYSKGYKIVWQIDDDLFNIPPWNYASRLVRDSDKAFIKELIPYWHKIITTTQELSDVIGQPDKTLVLPNLLDLTHFISKKTTQSNKIKILWAGSNSHDGDLVQLIDPVNNIIKKYDVQFMFWGSIPIELSNCVKGANGIIQLPKNPKNICFIGATTLNQYYDILNGLKADIALAPLVDCRFNHCKSNLKSLEMIMSGAALIASSISPYKWLGKDYGVLVQNEWEEAIEHLMSIDRQPMIRAGQEYIKNNFSWQNNRDIWLNAFRDLWKNS